MVVLAAIAYAGICLFSKKEIQEPIISAPDIPSTGGSVQLSESKIVGYFGCSDDSPGSTSTIKMTRTENGTFGCKTEATTEFITRIVRGDLNGDGYEDAIVEEGHCGASCGIGLILIINQKNGEGALFSGDFKSLVTSGAGQTGIQSISIENGTVSIAAYGFAGSKNPNEVVTKKLKLEGSRLVEM